MASLVEGSTINGNKIDAFETNIKKTFRSSAAPTNWTKDTSYNQNCFRCVTGNVSSGGNQDFTAAFDSRGISGNISVSTGNHALSTAQIPNHTHHQIFKNSYYNDWDKSGGHGTGRNPQHGHSNNSGSSQGHNHSASGNFSGNNLDLRVKYVDLILANKQN